MTVAASAPSSAPRIVTRTASTQPALLIAAVASLAAGAIHAAAIGGHNGAPQMQAAFVAVAVFQIGWAAATMSRARSVILAGAVGNACLVCGWLLAKSRGVAFIDGLETPEPPAFADGLAAAFALVSVLFALAHVSGRVEPWRANRWMPLLGTVLVVALAMPGMMLASSGSHHDEAQDAHTSAAAATPAATAPAVARPFDPSLPVDLGGVDGVTPQQQAAAENLVSASLVMLPRFADPAIAEQNGYRSIGDAATGYEHYVNRDYMRDGRELDPAYPESLVYRGGVDGKTLVAAMYMLEPGATLDTVPELGGPLTQWHIHDNLCFTTGGTVAGLTRPDGSCSPPLVKNEPVPMIHVWLTKHPCGPFAALDGIAGGQIKPGETRLCDTAHGSH